MTTRVDVLNAEDRFNQHVGSHHCKLGDGCPIRLGLWQAWMATAERWDT
jgi:hypothetical protein